MSVESAKFPAERVKQLRRARFNPIASLEPLTLTRQIEQFHQGWLGEFSLTADSIRRRDDVIVIALPKREKAVSRRSWSIILNEGLDDAQKQEAALHQEALQFFYDHLTATDVLEQNARGGFSMLARQMMRAVSMRYAVHEIVWEPRVDPRTRADRLTATFVHAPLQFFENATGRLRFLETPYAGVEGIDMDEREWLVTVGEGIMEALSVAYMFKRMSLQDWVGYNEKFGTPGIHAKTDATKGSEAWDTVVAAVESFSQDFGAVTSRETEFALIEAQAGGSLPFPPLVERMDRAIAAICRGADLSTMSAGEGSGQGASLQGDESLLLEEDDAAMITDALDAVSRIVIQQLFGADAPLAYLQIIVPRPKTTQDVIAKLEFLTRHSVPVAIDYARQELDVQAPDDDAGDEDLLQAPAPPPAPLSPSPSARAQLGNAGRADTFRSVALRQLSATQAHALAPVLDRLAAIEQLPDDKFAGALHAFRADLPRLYRDVLADKTLAAAFEQILGSALLDGAATAQQTTITA